MANSPNRIVADSSTLRASALECAACLDVMIAKRLIEKTLSDDGKSSLVEIVSMLVGLIRANSTERNH